MTRKLFFTQHVRDLVRGNVTPEELEAPWDKLRDALLSEMRSRALLAASPACLGIYGLTSWTAEAIDELASDCYTAVFLRRLPSLAAQLEHKANVEGLIFRNIRYYLHEMQRKHDPVGFRVFTVLRSAVCTAVDRGDLRIEHGDPEVRNETLLAVPTRVPNHSELDFPRRDESDLATIVRRWSEDLLPDLVTARGKAIDPVAEDLADRLARLADAGISTFRFQDISKLLKDQVRSRWDTLWARDLTQRHVDRELEDLSMAVRPPSTFEEREAFEKLVACVGETIEVTPQSTRTRSELHRLWIFLWSHAIEDGSTVPSQRHLSEVLDIPRARFTKLYATLGQTMALCYETFSGSKAPRKHSSEVRKKVEML